MSSKPRYMQCSETDFQKWTSKLYEKFKKQGGQLEFLEFVTIFEAPLRCIFMPSVPKFKEMIDQMVKLMNHLNQKANEKSVQLRPADETKN